MYLPSKANFFADARWTVAADLGGNCVEGQKVLAEILQWSATTDTLE